MKRKFPRWLKILLIIMGVVILAGLVLFFVNNEPRPEGTSGEAAELMAKNIQTAIDINAWDTTEVIQWNFADRHSFLWDKERHWVKVNWSDNEALIRIDSLDGMVWAKGVEVTEAKKKAKMLKKAHHFLF